MICDCSMFTGEIINIETVLHSRASDHLFQFDQVRKRTCWFEFGYNMMAPDAQHYTFFLRVFTLKRGQEPTPKKGHIGMTSFEVGSLHFIYKYSILEAAHTVARQLIFLSMAERPIITKWRSPNTPVIFIFCKAVVTDNYLKVKVTEALICELYQLLYLYLWSCLNNK